MFKEQKRKIQDFEISSNLPLFFKEILASRGVVKDSQLDLSLTNLEHFSALKDIDIACNILFDAYKQNTKITIVGDFDTDGATSTALCIRCLTDLGFLNLDYVLANRFTTGYGLSLELAQKLFFKKGDIFITVDSGITSFLGVDFLKNKGAKVIICDHHMQKDNLPNADAIVNPKQKDCEFKSKNLAGVGVAFYLMLAIRAKLKETNLASSKVNFAKYLDIVALGTIADLVPLDFCNRILVNYGLQQIKTKQTIPAISEILKIEGKNLNFLISEDLAFSIAPKLNAAGRLDDMTLGVKLLLEDDKLKAQKLIKTLIKLNTKRKNIQEKMLLSAKDQIKKDYPKTIKNSVVIYDDSWHKGVIGIIASKIKEQYELPSFIFALDEMSLGKNLVASARSIVGLDIYEVLLKVDQNQPDLMINFGGHKMAAGVSILKQNFNLFKQTLDSVLEQTKVKEQIIMHDGSLDVENINYQTALLFNNFCPWGSCFDYPSFKDTFEIKSKKIIKNKHLFLELYISREKYKKAIYFNLENIHSTFSSLTRKITIIYKLIINDFYKNVDYELRILKVL